MTGTPTLVAPSGTVSSPRPTFTWTSVPGATWYYLAINGPSGAVFAQWLDVASVTCSAGVCSYTPAVTLTNGPHFWGGAAYSPAGGYSPTSAIWSFTVNLPVTGTPTLVAPSGTVTVSRPPFGWSAVPGATWYYLVINGPSGIVFAQWLDAAGVACTAGTCSYTPAITLVNGAHAWGVAAYSAGGYGATTAPGSFTVSLPVTGVPTLVSPSGTIDSVRPTFTWNTVSGATWYLLYLDESVPGSSSASGSI